MSLLLILFFTCLAATACLSVKNDLPTTTNSATFRPLSAQDYSALDSPATSRHKRSTSLPRGFRSIYVDWHGQITNTNTGMEIQVSVSPMSNLTALTAAADIIAGMTKDMPWRVFYDIATRCSVGVFSREETLSIYPGLRHMANGNCGESCDSWCSRTCTEDGRKWGTVAGAGWRRSVVLDDNVLCNSQDPYSGTFNVLAHEFVHTIHLYALSWTTKWYINNAYLIATMWSTWGDNSYAMSNYLEYFATGGTVFFGVDRNGEDKTGGMNMCSGRLCPTVAEARANLASRDSRLYEQLLYVFADNQAGTESVLQVCPAGSAWPAATDDDGDDQGHFNN